MLHADWNDPAETEREAADAEDKKYNCRSNIFEKN